MTRDPDQLFVEGEAVVGPRVAAEAMSSVHLAAIKRGGRTVAAVLHRVPDGLGDEDTFMAAFERQARLRATLEGHGVPRVYGAHGIGGQIRGVLEAYVGGLRLGRVLRLCAEAQRLAPLPLVVAAARAMATAWRAAERHDPALGMSITAYDVLVGFDGEVTLQVRPYPSWTEQSRGAAAGLAHGQFEWLAPEVVRGEPADGRAAMHTLGAMLQEILSGVSPFRGDGPLPTLSRIVRGTRTPTLQLRPDTPERLAAVVDRCLSVSAAARVPSWAELYDVLHDVAGPPDPEAAASLLATLAPERRTHDERTVAWLEALRLDAIRPTLPVEPMVPVPVEQLPRGGAATKRAAYVENAEHVEHTEPTGIEYWPHDARAMHRVGDLLVDVAPVTHVELARFIIATGRPPLAEWGGSSPPPSLFDTPATGVSHSLAVAYARWAHKSLLTETELATLDLGTLWEWSATAAEGRGFVVRCVGGQRAVAVEPWSAIGFRCRAG